MRLGGNFPLGQTAIPVPLPSGGIFTPPAGNYLVTTGLVTVLQYFDPTLLEWRVYAQPGAEAMPVAMDGANWRLVNMSGVVIDASITNAGSGAVNGIGAAATGVAVSFGAAPTGGVAAAGYAIVGGSINTTITITNGGSGFLVPPLLLIDPPPPGGIQATAVVSALTAGAISGVTVTNAGAGYVTAPNVYVIPQPAVYGAAAAGIVNNPINTPYSLVIPQTGIVGNVAGGAQLTVNATLTGSGTVTGIVITNMGGGYTGTTIPTIAITGAGAAAATAVMSLSATSVTLGAGGAGYGAGAPPNWETSLGFIKGSKNNGILLPRCARGVTTVGAGAVATFVIEDPGFGFHKVPVAEVINTSAVATTIATGTVVCGGVNDVSLLQPAVQ